MLLETHFQSTEIFHFQAVRVTNGLSFCVCVCVCYQSDIEGLGPKIKFNSHQHINSRTWGRGKCRNPAVVPSWSRENSNWIVMVGSYICCIVGPRSNTITPWWDTGIEMKSWELKFVIALWQAIRIGSAVSTYGMGETGTSIKRCLCCMVTMVIFWLPQQLAKKVTYV